MTSKPRTRSHADKAREKRITWKILVDAYTPTEQAMGWYYYLEDALQFPFTARCVAKRAISPLKKGDEVEVIGMAPEEECEREVFVMIRWERHGLAIPRCLRALKRSGKMKNRSILCTAGAWANVTGAIMQSVIVVYITAVPTAATERQAAPLEATAIAFDARSVTTTAIIVDAQSAGTNCLPMDWADEARLVTAS